MFARLLRDPLFVFLVAGAVLYAAYALLESRRSERVHLTAEARAALIADYEALTGNRPGDEDVARLEREYVAEEILFREAIADGLHLRDGGVRARLVEQMRVGIASLLPEPDEEQLINHYAEHLELYKSEPSVSFEQVYFSTLPANAEAIAEKLRAGGEVRGESFRYGLKFPRYGRSMLRGMFGQPFIAALWDAPLGEWTGPIQSTQGWHFVRPAERLPEALLPFDAVRDQVEGDFRSAQVQQAVDSRVTELAPRYEVEIER
jgi:peptidyl-prolyl cis-trans isomerase C